MTNEQRAEYEHEMRNDAAALLAELESERDRLAREMR
jgi:hypothetical protein